MDVRARQKRKLSFECAGLTARDTVLVAVAMDRCFHGGAGILARITGNRLQCRAQRGVVAFVGAGNDSACSADGDRWRAVIPAPRRGQSAEAGVDLKTSPVNKLVCIGEPIRDVTFNLNASGTALEAAWGAKVYSTYGVTELANSLCECEAGQGGHLHEDQLCLEILDEAGQPVADGAVGRSRRDDVRRRSDAGDPIPHGRLRGNVSRTVRLWPTTPNWPIIGRKNQN